MGTNTRNNLSYYLRAVQALQRHSTHCRISIDYDSEGKALFVDIGQGVEYPYSFDFRADWAVADKNHNHMEQLKAIWEQYEKD